MRRLISLIAVAVLAVALGPLSVGPAAAGNNSNRDAAKRCLHEGWQDLSRPARSSGTGVTVSAPGPTAGRA
jgi:hypothetical protein